MMEANFVINSYYKLHTRNIVTMLYEQLHNNVFITICQRGEVLSTFKTLTNSKQNY